MDFIVPFVGTLGFGGLMGYAVGFAAKKAAKLLLVLLGVLFFLVQYLVFKGYITVDWNGIALHGGEAAKSGGEWFWTIATYNVPLGVGFTAGILLGFRKG